MNASTWREQSAEYVIEIGFSKIERVGTDVTVFSFSKTDGLALEAAEVIKEKGLS